MDLEIKKEFDEISDSIFEIIDRLQIIINSGKIKGVDLISAQRISTDFRWAAENCTVIGLHSIGKAIGQLPLS